MANDVTLREGKTGIATYLRNDGVRANVASVVGEKNLMSFVSSVVSAVQTNPALAECTNRSILYAALLGESLQLTPSPQLGQYYLVPYKKNGVSEATFQIGAKGYIQLAIRSGQYRRIVVNEIKEGELKSWNPITEEFILAPVMDDSIRSKLETIGYYAMFELVNGYRKEIYWSKEKMLHHADRYSQAFSLNGHGGKYPKKSYADYLAGKVPDDEMWKYSSFWYKDFDGMAKKTLIRQLISKWGIMSVQMQRAYEGDMGVISEDGSIRYIDNEPETAKEKAEGEISGNENASEFVVEEANEE